MDPSSGSPRVVCFGVFEVDLRSAELRKPGSKISLQDKPLQILTLLLEHPGEMVTREELQKRLWPDGIIVDFEHSINTAVKRWATTPSIHASLKLCPAAAIALSRPFNPRGRRAVRKL